jgi:hypothetical protein
MTAALIADDSMHLPAGQQQQGEDLGLHGKAAGSPLADPTLGGVDQAVEDGHEGR